MTKIWNVEPERAEAHHVWAEAGAVIAEGGIVAFPTETVYGLGADAGNTNAVEAIYAAKGRPSDNPLIVHIAHIGQLDDLVREVDPTSWRLIEAFWPGPLTLVLPVRPSAVSSRVTAGLDTIAVRMPDHPAALALIRAAGCPVAAPSANRSGRPSPTTAAHVLGDLDGCIDGIVDSGPTGVGLESTVAIIEQGGALIRVLRPGGVTIEDLQRVAPEADVTADLAEQSSAVPRSPGMKYAHYAPQGRLTVVRGEAGRATAWIRDSLAKASRAGERTGVLTATERMPLYEADLVIGCGSSGDMGSAAKQLYAALRKFDEAGITFILAEGYDSEEGIGLAVMNRLHKAAGYRIVDV